MLMQDFKKYYINIILLVVLPQVQSFPDSISNCPSSVVYLKCAFENNENRPIVTWYKNNHRIGSNAMNSQNRYLIERHSGYSVLPNGTLEITRTISSTSGRYQCKAETKNGVKPGNQYELRDSEGKNICYFLRKKSSFFM